VLCSFLPLVSVAIFGACIYGRIECARFGTLLGATIVLSTAGVAGAAFGRIERFGFAGAMRGTRAAIMIVELAVIATCGLFTAYRCFVVWRWGRIRIGEDEKEDDDSDDTLARASSALRALLRHVISWGIALVGLVVSMNVAASGGPKARPALACAISTCFVLPVLHEMLATRLFAWTMLEDRLRLSCLVFAMLSTATAAALLASGLVLPFVHAVAGTWDPIVTVCGDADRTHSDCTVLAVRTYAALLGAIVMLVYASYKGSGFICAPEVFLTFF
jgi:hypothetical protein